MVIVVPPPSPAQPAGPGLAQRLAEGIASNLASTAAISVLAVVLATGSLGLWTGVTVDTFDGFVLLPAINADRVANGEAPLGADRRLMAIAQERATAMANTALLSHHVAGSIADQLDRAGVAWDGYGEVIAWTGAAATLAEAADVANQLWVGSAPHSAVIDGGSFQSLGAGAATGADGRIYWVALFT